MKANIEGLLPTVTSSLINKVLFLEVFFLLRSGKSPVYFSLSDFVDNYSIEIFYIAVLFSMLAAWIAIPAFAFYYVVVGSLSWCGRAILGLFKFEGIPIFKALGQQEREKSVSTEVAIDFAKSKPDLDLLARITEYEKNTQERIKNEAIATANFALVGAIVVTSYLTGAPNFLMKITSFADQFTPDAAYKVCIILLAIQGILGRATNFYLIRAAANLPPNFFVDEAERNEVNGWASKIIERQIPLAQNWINRD